MDYDWSDKTILIVEDSDTVNMFFKAALRKTKLTLLWAQTGNEAINICRENNGINLVLMDILLPEMDGYQATKEIRKIRKDLPVIAQTAHILENSKEKSIAAGCTDYITKPIRLSVLFSVIDKYIS